MLRKAMNAPPAGPWPLTARILSSISIPTVVACFGFVIVNPSVVRIASTNSDSIS